MRILPNLRGNEYGQRWAIWHTFLIPTPDGARTYLKRIRIVQTPHFGLYLHWIYFADGDRDPHDHPWNFWSFIVRGGYTECIWKMQPGLGALRVTPARWRREDDPGRVARRGRFSLHRHPTSIAHTIAELKPGTVTLVFVGRRQREWGFWTPDGFVEWKAYERNGLGPATEGVAP